MISDKDYRDLESKARALVPPGHVLTGWELRLGGTVNGVRVSEPGLYVFYTPTRLMGA